MNPLVQQGIRIFHRLKYRAKFSLISIIFIAPLVVLGLLLLSDLNQEVDQLRNQRAGLEYIGSIRPLIQQIPQHRGMSGAFLNGGEEFRRKMLSRQQAIEKGFAGLTGIDQHLGSVLNTGSRVERLHASWNELKKRAFEMTPARSFQEHTDLVAGLLELTESAAVQSGLVLDSNIDTYYLMDAIVFRLPALVEAMGQSRAIGSGAAASGSLDRRTWAQLAIRLDRIEKTQRALERGLAETFEKNPQLEERLTGLGQQVRSTVGRFSKLIERDLLSPERVTVSTTEIYEASTRAIDAIFGLYDIVAPAYDELLRQRIAKARQTVNGAVTAMAVVLVLLLYLRRLESANLRLEERVNARTAELRSANDRIGSIIKNASDAIVKIDSHQTICLFNPGAERMFGYRADEVVGKPLSILLPDEAREFYSKKIQQLVTNSTPSRPNYEVHGLHKDGTIFPAEATISRMVLDGELYFTAFVRDISERKAAEDRIRKMAMTDSLTGLANRRHIQQRLQEAMAYADRLGHKVGLLLLDLDNFKPVNDTYGHQAGDKLLKQVAGVFRENLRETDVVGRLGGDEFAVVVTGLKDTADLGPISKKLLKPIAQLNEIDGCPIRIGASIGGSVYPDDGGQVDILLAKADKALYSAKALGKNTYCIHGQRSTDSA